MIVPSSIYPYFLLILPDSLHLFTSPLLPLYYSLVCLPEISRQGIKTKTNSVSCTVPNLT